jgi:signal peptidase I
VLNPRFRVWARDIAISVVASFFIVTVFYQPVRVEGTSMQPELSDQDRLFIDKFFFRFEKINRGDVVVFHYPRDPEKSYIKRVIGLTGASGSTASRATKSTSPAVIATPAPWPK